MAIFTPYTSSPNDPNYLGYSKQPDPVKPDLSAAKIIEGLGETVDLGIKGYDEYNKQSIIHEGSARFTGANKAKIDELQALRDKLSGGKNIPGYVPPEPSAGEDSASPPMSFAAPPETDMPPVGPFNRSGTIGDEKDKPLPPQVTRSIDRLRKLAEVGLNDKINSTGLQMNGEAIMSDLLQRYPGYSEQIRSLASRYGFGDVQQIRQLQTEINQFLNAKNSEDAKHEAWENTNRAGLTGTKERPGADPDYFRRSHEERRSPQYRDYLQERLGHLDAISSMNNLEKSSIELSNAKDAGTANKVLSGEESRAQTVFGSMFTHEMRKVGIDVQNVDDFMEKLRNDPNMLDSTRQQQVGQALEALKTTFKSRMLREAGGMKVGDQGDTRLSVGTSDKLGAIYDRTASVIGEMQKIVSSKGAKESFDFANIAGRETEAWTNVQTRKIQKDLPSIAMMKPLRDHVGDNIAAQLYQTQGSAIKSKIDDGAKLLISGTVTGIVTGAPDKTTGRPMTISDTLRKYTNDWDLGKYDSTTGQMAVKPQDLNALSQQIKANILNPNFPTDWAVKHANYFFDNNFFANIKDSEKYKFLAEYGSPEMSKRILSLGDAELTQKYKSWLGDAARTTTQQVISDFQKVAETSENQGTKFKNYDTTRFYDLVFDPKTNRIVETYASPQTIIAATKIERPNGVSTVDSYAHDSVTRGLATVKNTVSKLNTVLGILEPVLKQEKSEVSPELLGTLTSMGIKIKVEEGAANSRRTPPVQPLDLPVPLPGKRSENDGGTLDQVADITNISPASLQMQSPAPRVNTRINPNYPTGVRIQSKLGFADEQLPSSGNVSVEDFVANPSGVLKTPVKAQGGVGKRKSSNLSDSDWMNIQVDAIPDGMSARDFIKVLQQRDKSRP